MKTLVFGLFVFSSVTGGKLPSNFPKCNYGKSDFNNCLSRAIKDVALTLTQPIPKAGLPTLEPLDIHSFLIAAGNGPVRVQESFKNAKLFGLRHIKVKKAAVSFHPDDLSMNFTCEFPRLEIFAQYQLDGKVMLLPIQGEGNASILLKNLTAVGTFPLEIVLKRGEKYIRVTSAGKIKLPMLDLLYMKFENLFNGNEQLGDTLNTIINENWLPIFNDVRSSYEALFTEYIVRIFNNFFKKIPLTEMVENVDVKNLN